MGNSSKEQKEFKEDCKERLDEMELKDCINVTALPIKTRIPLYAGKTIYLSYSEWLPLNKPCEMCCGEGKIIFVNKKTERHEITCPRCQGENDEKAYIGQFSKWVVGRYILSAITFSGTKIDSIRLSPLGDGQPILLQQDNLKEMRFYDRYLSYDYNEVLKEVKQLNREAAEQK